MNPRIVYCTLALAGCSTQTPTLDQHSEHGGFTEVIVCALPSFPTGVIYCGLAPLPSDVQSTEVQPAAYKVKPGDTLSGLIRRFHQHDTRDTVVSRNSIADPDLIYAGQTLMINQNGAQPENPAYPSPAAGSGR